ncbi:MAG: helix-turn-helix domain-containing protein [Thaumarchaeota archaeon]|nr:helix-turn-helix domain-containing protein [Nitrososphaerota archaeon]
MKLIKVGEAAEILQVRPETVYRWIYRGFLPSIKLGRTVRIDQVELKRLLAGLPPPITAKFNNERGSHE